MTEREPYLMKLDRRLAESIVDWPAHRKRPLACFVRGKQDDSGGFAGRGGAADLYYTAFALRTLAAMCELDSRTRAAARPYVEAAPAIGAIDMVSKLSAICMVEGSRRRVGDPQTFPVGDHLESFRCADGGWGKTPRAAGSSMYHTFLAVLCYDLVGEDPPNVEALAAFVRSRRQPDGGFAELPQMPCSSVNPTAAGAALVRVTRGMDDTMLTGASSFLLAAQRHDGGWSASPRVPESDLLSTFTALLTLSDLGTLARADRDGAGRFVQACQIDSGGYGGSPKDCRADVEYTFYGLAASAILGT